ncbi:MAG TPA: AEC family transporter [Desulfoprunum sp.]|nr:AEC family transporter [Desulfoprunum sp.]
MPLFLDILIIVLPVFLVIGLGFGLKIARLVDGSFLHQLNRLVYFLALPALLFHEIARSDFSASFNGLLLVGMLAAVLLTSFLAYGFTVWRGYPPEVCGSFCQGTFRGNIAYIGLAIVFNAYGGEGLATAGILLGFLVPFYNFFGILALLLPHRQQGQHFGPWFWIRQIGGNPLIISSFAGILWSFLDIPLPQVIERSLDIVSGMALPLALLAIGGSFSLQRLRGDISKSLIATAVKLIWLPLLTAGILLVLGIRGRDLAIGVIFAGTPTATVAYIMAQQMRGDAELSGSIIMLSTLLSLITYTVALVLLEGLGL